METEDLCVKLLLIEDEKRMAEAVSEILRYEGYSVDWRDNGIDGLAALESGLYDIAVIDVMLPRMNGCELVKKARAGGVKTPALMLSARSELDDKVIGLDSGADDYLTKPFMSRELLARLRALARRGAGDTDSELCFGDIRIDRGTLNLSCDRSHQSVRLGDKEYRILEYLIANKGSILTREQIAVKIWGYDNDAEYNNVEVYMSFTRKKLSFVRSETRIKAVRGVGYELRYKNADDI